MFKFLLRTILKLGGIAVVTGCIGFLVMLVCLTYLAPIGIASQVFLVYLQTTALQISIATGFASGFLGWMLDSYFDITRRLIAKVWIRQQEAVTQQYSAGRIDYRQALEKYFVAAHELNPSPNLLSRLFSSSTNSISKEVLKEQLWIVKNVLPLLPKNYLPNTKELSRWVQIVDELHRHYSFAKQYQNIWHRLFGGSKKMAKTIVNLFIDDRLSEKHRRIEAAKARNAKRQGEQGQSGTTIVETREERLLNPQSVSGDVQTIMDAAKKNKIS